jgi:hypothetical protein
MLVHDIIRPLYIDIDIKSHELFVLTNDGKSVYCFEKQMDDDISVSVTCHTFSNVFAWYLKIIRLSRSRNIKTCNIVG